MNLVIDDAVEVKQPTKTDSGGARRELGEFRAFLGYEDNLNSNQVKYC